MSKEAPGTVLLGSNMTSTLTVGVRQPAMCRLLKPPLRQVLIPAGAPLSSRHLLEVMAAPSSGPALALR